MRLLDWWKNKPRRESAIRLLREEVDSNLKLLEGWWRKVKPRKSDEESHWVDKVVYARDLADADLPEFSLQVYSRYQPSLAQYLRRDRAKQLAQFYQGLSRLEEIQAELRRELEKDLTLRRPTEGQSSSPGEVSPRYENFLKIAPWSWREAAQMIDKMLTGGNPLGKKK